MSREYDLAHTRNMASWPISMQARLLLLKRILYFTGKSTKSAKPMRVAQRWTGWNKNKKEALLLLPQLQPRHGR